MIDAGRHTARATGPEDAEFGQSPNGTDYLYVLFKLKGGSQDGQSIGAYFYFSEAAQEKAIEGLRNAGCTFPGGDVTNLAGLGSKDVSLVVEHEEYEGKTKAKVKWVNKVGGVKEDQVLDQSERSALKSRMRGVLAAMGAAGPKAEPEPAPIDDSDIPF